MNEKIHNSIKKAGEGISLTHDERARMRRTLRAYMEMKPLRTPAPVPVPAFGRFFTMRPVAATLILALFASSAGISYAAEDALPGDLLYPVKTRVNEPMRGALALSASAKTAWAMDVAGTRVQEAATLAAEGRLTPSTQRELQADFEQHAKQATEAIADNASSSPDASTEAAVRFEAELSEYGNVLAQIGAAKQVDVGQFASSIQNERGRIAAVRMRVESSDTDHSSAAGRMGIAARAQLDTSVKLAHAVSGSLSSSSVEIVGAQLDDASTSISAGEDFAAHNAGHDAVDAFQNALSATEKIGVFLNTSSAIHARTGIVVGEPRKSKREGQNGEEGPSHDMSAAAINNAATSSEAAPPVETPENTDVKKSGGNEQQNETSGEQVLPVSVPVHLPF